MASSGSWYNLDWLCCSRMWSWVGAAVKEDLRAKKHGFGRVRRSWRFGHGPDLRPIDTHLRFLCIPPLTHTHTLPPLTIYTLMCILSLHAPWYSRPPPPMHSSSHSLSAESLSLTFRSYLCTSQDILIRDTSNFTVLKASVAWFWVLSGSGKCSCRHDMGKQRKKKSCTYGQGYCKKTKHSLWVSLWQLE